MKKYLLVTITILISSLIGSPAILAAADRTFTNEDLERYKGEDDGAIIPEKAPQAMKKENRASGAAEEKSKKYWCAKGSTMRAKVDKAKDKVADAERKLADNEEPTVTKKKNISTQKKHATAEKKVRSAKKELYRAEQSLEALEQDAHRQNIPPGWLRCQFTY